MMETWNFLVLLLSNLHWMIIGAWVWSYIQDDTGKYSITRAMRRGWDNLAGRYDAA